ncbi:hypothetical protein NQ314_021339 [Rhamnusium bicolor]|uniref:Uncharacterized protein n=1 Tax=Rhamnusium bicolor TaxID=1586634 RepID=A0AAV8WIG7_9CUCU|nr:hypothetical protein NQ314_021339 [Rhamnusium bicolor]
MTAKLPKVLNIETKETVKEITLNKSVNAKDLVRTDSKEQKLQKFFGAPIKKVKQLKLGRLM